MDWRWAAYPAAVAFTLSLLTGIIAGVDFLTLLLRALLGSALFAALGSGASALIERQLPELLQTPAPSSEASRPRVDITVGDDEETGQREDSSDDEAVDSLDDENEEAGEGEAAFQSLEADQIEEVTPKEEAPSRTPPPRREEQDITESLVEEVEESALPDEELTKASHFEEEENNNSEELESVDELPDIGGFEGAFDGDGPPSSEGGEEEGLSDYGSSSSSRSSRSAPEGLEAGNDPAQIAKAMQTMLKRDS